MLNSRHLEPLKGHKILLAYSGGIDSSALFYLLKKSHITFDIAIVDYQLRAQSHQETKDAIALAQAHKLICHHTKAPHFKANFESQARRFRYDYFLSLSQKHNYTLLLTAHQLNDRLEWLLMRLGKGAGVCELTGLAPKGRYQSLQIYRPLLEFTKEELLNYLKEANLPYSIDSTNSDLSYERNWIRHELSDKLLSRYKQGIRRSFEILQKQCEPFRPNTTPTKQSQSLYCFKAKSKEAALEALNIHLKHHGYLLSYAQKNEILKHKDLVIGDRYAIGWIDSTLYLCPKTKSTIPKADKERFRKANIPKHIRPYIYLQKIDLAFFTTP